MENLSQNVKPRRMWIAFLLGLFIGPLAQVYVGRFRRAVWLWVGEILLLCLSGVVFVAARFELYALYLLAIIAILYRLFIIFDACRIARRDRDEPLKRYQRTWVYIALFFAFYFLNTIAGYAVAYSLKTFFADAFKIVGRSMSPAIQPGDRILVDKFWVSPEQIQRNDIIVFRTHLEGSPVFITRVIGLPGETIEIRDERVLINGEPIEDSHAFLEGTVPEYFPEQLLNYGPEKIPEDCFFVLGDNRRLSKDSRFIGPISFEDYIGKAIFIYWSREYTPIESYSPYGPQYKLGPTQWDRIGSRLD